MNRFAIDRNHRELVGLLAWLFVSIGLADTLAEARDRAPIPCCSRGG